MDKLNKLRLLAGVPIRHIPSTPSKLMEARTVPARKSDLAPQTEENMKARVAYMNAAAMHVAKAIEALEKIPATNFMGDVPHFVTELSTLLDGESAGGGDGMKALVSAFQTEYRSWKRKTNAMARAQQPEAAVAEALEFDELDDHVPEDPHEFADKSADLDAMAHGEVGNEVVDGEGETSPEVAAKIAAYAKEAGFDTDGEGEFADAVDADQVGDERTLDDLGDDKEFSDDGLGDEGLGDKFADDEFDYPTDPLDDEDSGAADLEDPGYGEDDGRFAEFDESAPAIADKDESPNQLHNVEPSPGDHDKKVHVPSTVKQALRDEAAQARKEAKELGVTDKDAKWFYENLATAFEELLGHLEKGTVYDIKKAQIFMTSLMGPMLHKIPANVVNFVAKGGEERKLSDYMKPVDKKYPVTGKMYKGE